MYDMGLKDAYVGSAFHLLGNSMLGGIKQPSCGINPNICRIFHYAGGDISNDPEKRFVESKMWGVL